MKLFAIFGMSDISLDYLKNIFDLDFFEDDFFELFFLISKVHTLVNTYILIHFPMETRYIMILLLLATVASAQGYLDSLRVLKIEHSLIDQANWALHDLKGFLNTFMRCGD